MSGTVLTLVELEQFDCRAPTHGNERRFCCPLPACSDKPVDAEHRSLTVNVSSGAWHCFRCKGSGLLREHWTPRKDAARAVLRNRFALSQPAPRAPERPENAPAPAQTEKRTAAYWQAVYARLPLLPGTAAAPYIASRGIPLDLAEAAGLRAGTVRARPAVFVPITDRAGDLVALHARYFDAGQPKAQTWGSKSLGVFASPGALTATPIVIVEGPFDALTLAAAGLPAIALIGTSGPPWLRRHCAFRPVLIATDADKAGDDAAAALAAELTLSSTVRRLRPAGAKDWNDQLRAGQLDADALRAAAFGQCEDVPPVAPCSRLGCDQLAADDQPGGWCVAHRNRGEVLRIVAGLEWPAVELDDGLLLNDERSWRDWAASVAQDWIDDSLRAAAVGNGRERMQ